MFIRYLLAKMAQKLIRAILIVINLFILNTYVVSKSNVMIKADEGLEYV